MVMSRIASYQSGPAGTGYTTGPNFQASIGANVSGSVDTGGSMWTGVVVLVALAIVLLGKHGLT